MTELVEKIRSLMRQENGEMNRFIAVKNFDKDHIIIYWKYPLMGYDSVIFVKNN